MAGYPPQPGGNPNQQGQPGPYQGGQNQQQYGQQQYGQQYGQQQYGQPYPPQPYGHPGYAPQQAQGIPGTVIAGFICAFLCPLIGLILCAVGMGEAKRRNAGVGLATAGIIVAVVMLPFNVVYIVGSRA